MNDLVEQAKQMICAMSAKEAAESVVKMCLDAALGEPTIKECNEPVLPWTYGALTHQSIRKVFANRKSGLLAPKTVEERVTVRREPGSGVGVFKDGMLALPQFFLQTEDAEIYRKGLIAEMKERHNGSE